MKVQHKSYEEQQLILSEVHTRIDIILFYSIRLYYNTQAN